MIRFLRHAAGIRAASGFSRACISANRGAICFTNSLTRLSEVRRITPVLVSSQPYLVDQHSCELGVEKFTCTVMRDPVPSPNLQSGVIETRREVFT